MKWIAKALLQKALSAFPDGERYNYFLQRKTGALPVSGSEFVEKVRLAHERLRRWEEFGSRPLAKVRCFEFGAGWDLIGPLSYWGFGVESQLVIDIRPNLKLELLQDTLSKFRRYRNECEAITGRRLRLFDDKTITDASDLKRQFGITYSAPTDAAATQVESGSVDFISTNSTLEHIPESSLRRILAESKRILSAGGLQCHFIDMKDHFSYFDQSISRYNFLTISDPVWACLNSTLSFQNRLRYADYIRLFAEAGFTVINEDVDAAPPSDIAILSGLKLSRRFAGTDLAERLATHVLRVVLK